MMARLWYLALNRIWVIGRDPLVSKKSKKFGAGEAGRASDCI
jgi:hypothetical protein